MSVPSKKSRNRSWLNFTLERRSASEFGLVLIIIMGCIGWVQTVPNMPVVLTIGAVVLYEFQKRLDQGVPLLQLTSLLAVLQWLIGPVLNYSTEFAYGRYSMYVDEAEYFQFAIPATSAYVSVILIAGVSVRQQNLLLALNRKHFVEIGIILNIVAMAATLAAGLVGGSLQFLMHLVSQLRYVGALYFLFSTNQFRLVLAVASCLPLLSRSLGSGMFHDLILWAAILFCFWFAQRRWNFATKTLVLLLCGAALFSIQVIKQDYRQQLREGRSPSIIPLVYDYVRPGGAAWGDEALSLVVTRLNQGWIISAVMKNVPEQEPFANGETISTAVENAVLPRILFKNKKKAGGRENFRRFTGLGIEETTSMGISPLGEAYANFGAKGGILFMLVFGVFFAVLYKASLQYVLKHPAFLFWVPLIFYQAIKAETELLVVINQLTKGGVVAFGCHFLISNMFPTGKAPRKLPTYGDPGVSASGVR